MTANRVEVDTSQLQVYEITEGKNPGSTITKFLWNRVVLPDWVTSMMGAGQNSPAKIRAAFYIVLFMSRLREQGVEYFYV